MEQTDLPLPPEMWAATPSAAQALIVALQARVRELEARLGQNSSNVVALLSGRYRLSCREVRQLLQDLWAVRVSLGAVVRQEQAQSAALAPIVEEARGAGQQAAVVNMDETGWRQEQRRAGVLGGGAGPPDAFLVDP